MKILKNTFIVLSLFTLLVCFNESNDWYQFDSNEYKILFPKLPSSTINQVSTEAGALQIQMYMYNASKDATDENLIYGISISEYPKDHITNHKEHDNFETFFKNSIYGMVNKVNGKLISETNISLDKYQGREIKIDFKNGLAIIKARFYLVNNTVYIIQTITKTENDNNKSIDKFMNSFELKNKN